MLRLCKIVKSFGEGAHPALKGITLDVKPGEFCVVLGGNGSGKSTLLKTISGEHPIDSGEIILEDQEITSHSLYERSGLMSCVTQDTARGTIAQMTVFENMCLSASRGKKSRLAFYEPQRDRFKNTLQELNLGLESYFSTPLGCLSGGQRQVIATLMAFLSTPKLLLLDEHTSALDAKTQKKIMDYTVQKIQNEKITTLMVTHNLQDAMLYGTRLLMMHQGNIIMDLQGEDKKRLTLKDLQELFYPPENTFSKNQEGSS